LPAGRRRSARAATRCHDRHELTPKARAFLHAAFCKADLDASHGGQPSIGIAVIQVPPRPFLAPVFETHAKPEEVSRRFLTRVAKHLGGDFGDI